MCRAIATYPSANNVRMIVANRKPAGAPRPLPQPTAIGTLPVMAVIGAALATAMKMTATMPMAPFLRPVAGDAAVVSTAADSVVTAGLLVRIRLHGVARDAAVRSEPRTPSPSRQPEDT